MGMKEKLLLAAAGILLFLLLLLLLSMAGFDIGSFRIGKVIYLG